MIWSKGEGTKVTLHYQPVWCHMVYGICFHLSDVCGEVAPWSNLREADADHIKRITRTTPFWMGQMHEPLWPGFLLFRHLCGIPHLDCRFFIRPKSRFRKLYLLIYYLKKKNQKTSLILNYTSILTLLRNKLIIIF
jgi:hypothetical protein